MRARATPSGRGAVRGDLPRDTGAHPAGIPAVAHATTHAGALAGFAQEARS
ncbi:hypothetical protein [Microbispora sp. H11081]|uniref:hypothetical protein n=1 Tax=Microbispora sp. H11081 TaxID=2729107 RepID=UPI0014762510|nr:hypothetical protein [Microbispora sp. H11081]